MTDLADWFADRQAKDAALYAQQAPAFAEHNTIVAARDLPFCWHRYHDDQRTAHECVNPRPCPDHAPKAAPTALPRFIVFAGHFHEAIEGAEGVLEPGPHAFHRVADAAEAAEAAIARRDRYGRPDYDWSQVAEVTTAGLRTVAQYDRTQASTMEKVAP